MLNSKRDESIKRYLRSIGTLKCKSKRFNSLYYSVNYSEELNVVIRFSDHFNDTKGSNKQNNIDITKVCEFYTIKIYSTGINYTVAENNIISYLKSILLLYPEIYKGCKKYVDAYKEVNKELVSKNSDITRAESVLNKIDGYKNKINELEDKNNNLTNKVNEYEKIIDDTRNIINSVKI